MRGERVLERGRLRMVFRSLSYSLDIHIEMPHGQLGIRVRTSRERSELGALG